MADGRSRDVLGQIAGGVTTMAARNAIAGELVEEVRRRLAQARREIYATFATTDEELATLEVHQPGSPPEDVVTETASAVLSRLEGREKHELDEIDAAQARLAAGTYGTCEGCGRPIPLERLRAVPTARYCVACQRREER
jgi:DnaK suppressor protein